MLYISCGHTTPPLVRVTQGGYSYEVCGGRRCQALLPAVENSTTVDISDTDAVAVPFAPYNKAHAEVLLAA